MTKWYKETVHYFLVYTSILYIWVGSYPSLLAFRRGIFWGSQVFSQLCYYYCSPLFFCLACRHSGAGACCFVLPREVGGTAWREGKYEWHRNRKVILHDNTPLWWCQGGHFGRWYCDWEWCGFRLLLMKVLCMCLARTRPEHTHADMGVCARKTHTQEF